MIIDVYNAEGKKNTKLDINDSIFHIVLNKQATFNSVLAENASLRQGTHSTKTKAEVSGGGKKPWAQKGTGNARQGSTRNPQWRHGGIVFGPKPTRNYTLKVNKKAHKLAMASIISDKFINNNYKVIDKFIFDKFSTKDAQTYLSTFFEALNTKKLLIIDSKFNEFLSKSVCNLDKITYLLANQVSVKDIMHHDFILLDVDTINYFNEVYK